MPLAFFRAVEDTLRATLQQGIYGWQVTDCTVTTIHSGYLARHSHADQGFAKEMSSTGADFRGLTPPVVMSALKRAGTVACEPDPPLPPRSPDGRACAVRVWSTGCPISTTAANVPRRP